MKKILFILGFCLLSVQSAAAQYTPVTDHYVKQILERADAGITHATSGDEGGDNSAGYNSTYRIANTAILDQIDTELRIEKKLSDLTDNTACLHIDLLLIENKMREVHDEIRSALSGGKPSAVTRLAELLEFLEGRYNALIEGASNPEFVDVGWGYLYSFDDKSQSFCCNEQQTCAPAGGNTCTNNSYKTLATCEASGCKANSEPQDYMCPFSTDYLPPTSAGYGCDEDILANYTAHGSTKKEYEALQELLQQRTEFLQNVQSISSTSLSISGGNQASGLLAGNQPHKVRYGCGGKEGGGNEDWRDDAALTELRGPFYFLQMDHLKIVTSFGDMRRQSLGDERNPADYLKRPSEYAKEEQDDAATQESTRAPIFDFFRQHGRDRIEPFTDEQILNEAYGFARWSEPQFYIAEAFTELRDAIANLSEIATSVTDGLRKFAIDLTYFLRRSCIYRPCNDKLDKVLKTLLEDKCFPYVSGDYEGNDKIEEECKQAAEKS